MPTPFMLDDPQERRNVRFMLAALFTHALLSSDRALGPREEIAQWAGKVADAVIADGTSPQ